MTRTHRTVALFVAATVLAATTVLARPAAATTACSNPFGASYRADLARRYPGVRITAAVADTATGCWYHLNPELRVTTASVIKAQILGAVLLKAQQEGRAISAWEQARITPMIRYSFNPETSALYAHVGGEPAMEATDAAFGATATSHSGFGLTRSSAADRTRVALRLLHDGGPLTQASREHAWAEMTAVHPLQRWGITAGVPDGWTVAQKNGFYPARGLGWRLGSSGFVRRDDADQGYGITVMVEGAPNQTTGIAIVEEVSRRVSGRLTVGAPASRAWDRRRCIATRVGESWTSAAGRLGLPASRAAEVRTIAGGNASPLIGQNACSPIVPSPPVPATSPVSGRYRPVAADLDGDGRDEVLWYGPGATGERRWQLAADGAFRAVDVPSIGGDATPLAGDLDGDGYDDVVWYGAGTRPDVIWYGGPTIVAVPVSITQLGVHPEIGDFDGDGRADLLLYRPGTATDEIWYGRAERGTFERAVVTVNGAYEPVVGDFDGNGADDVLWYAPGTGADRRWHGDPGVRSIRSTPSPRIDGRYRPFAADLDGDGADELLLYGPGALPDRRWDGWGAGRTSTIVTVSGEYQPVVGDLDGDGFEDVLWYGPGPRPDTGWRGGPTGTSPLAILRR